MIIAIYLISGLLLLGVGGEVLVRSAVAIARLARLTPAVVGLTVIAMGTSFPELAVSIMAARAEEPDIAVGNVIGSNIFNITAVLGVTALISGLPVHRAAVRLEWPVMFLAGIACIVLMRDGVLDRLEGGFFVVSLIAFTAYAVHIARREVKGREQAELEEAVETRSVPLSNWRGLAVALPAAAAGVALLALGGRLLVDGAVSLAQLLGMSERLIGLTIVAAGTGMPELVASLVAAARRQIDIIVSAMIGSSVFNMLGILGVAALAQPLRFSAVLGSTDLIWMIGASLLLLPILWGGMRVSRWEGILLLSAYIAYLFFL